jgi:centractin
VLIRLRSVGRPKHTRIMAGAVDGDVFIGAKAQELRGLLKIRYPLEHGIVTDWDDMEKIWSYIYSEELKTLPEEVTSRKRRVEVDESILCY